MARRPLPRHRAPGRGTEVPAHGLARTRNPWVTAVIVLATVLALVTAGGFGAIAYLNASRHVIANPLSTRPVPKYGAENILLLGSDTRGTIETGATAENPTTAEGNRSDTMLLVHIPADRKSVQIITLLRDMYVPIKDNGKGKLNWAMFFGGVPLAVDTVENLLDTKINHVVLVDFTGVQKIATALRGVTINNPTAFSYGGYDFPQGSITVKGASALAFVRGRHAFAEGDRKRVLNQQLFIQAAVNKALSGGTLTDPVAVTKVFNAIKDSLAVDAGIDVGYITKLATSFIGRSAQDARFMVLPTKGQFSRGPHTFWNVDEDQLAVIRYGLATDSLNLYTPPATQ